MFLRFNLPPNVIFQCFRPQTWQFYIFFPALSISGINNFLSIEFKVEQVMWPLAAKGAQVVNICHMEFVLYKFIIIIIIIKGQLQQWNLYSVTSWTLWWCALKTLILHQLNTFFTLSPETPAHHTVVTRQHEFQFVVFQVSPHICEFIRQRSSPDIGLVHAS